MTAWRKLVVVPALACLSLAMGGPARAEGGAASEDAVKAAYLYKLRNYIEWPPRARAPGDAMTVIGIVGADEVAGQLQAMPALRDPRKAPVTVRRLRTGDALSGVHILYVGASYWTRAGPMVAQAGALAILVVSETEGALAEGSMINFRLADERIRFDIALDTAEKAGLKMSSQLLTLALSVARERKK